MYFADFLPCVDCQYSTAFAYVVVFRKLLVGAWFEERVASDVLLLILLMLMVLRFCAD